jgi:predicted transcriptional regulator
VKVEELIKHRKEVFSLAHDATVHEAARYLREREVRSVGVMDAKSRLVGVISQSDISDKMAAENKCPAWMRVSEIMTRKLVTIPTDASLDDCLGSMEKHGVFHLLVVDLGETFLEMISVKDLLRVISTDHKSRADMLESFVFPQR